MSHTIAGADFSKIVLRSKDGAYAKAYAYDAHLVSWIPADGEERLFLSKRSEFRRDSAIRGGVLVIFPQFASLGPLPKHGFARTSSWKACEPTASGESVTFELRDSAATRMLWPHGFRASLTINITGSSLDLRLAIENTGADAFAFTTSYLSARCRSGRGGGQRTSASTLSRYGGRRR